MREGGFMKTTRIYQCEDTPEGIFSAVYDAGKSGYGHDYIQIQIVKNNTFYEQQLFSEYIVVGEDTVKMEKVLRSVRGKISWEVYEYIIRAAASVEEDKADVIYHFIVEGFRIGAKVTSALQIPCVQRMFEINRRVKNEAHYYLEFLRFREINLKQPVLLAVFEPNNAVLPFVVPHFADRLNPEWFVIYDKTHQQAAFHAPGQQWYIRKLEPEEGKQLEEWKETKEEYVDLWKAFFETIAIKERANSDLQRNNMPLHYRKHVTEFL